MADSVRISAEIHLKVLPIVQKCLDGMVAAAAEVNPAQVRFYAKIARSELRNFGEKKIETSISGIVLR